MRLYPSRLPSSLAALFALSLCTGAFAQVQAATPTVTTTGTATVYATPDRVELRFSVTVMDQDLATAKKNSDEAATKVIDFLRDAGIADADLQTAIVTSNAIYDDRYENGRPVRGELKGYEVYRGYGVTIKDMNKFAGVLDRLLTDTNVRVEGYTYKAAEDRKFRDQARREAAKAAREKAELLADTLNARVDSVRTIAESSPSPFYPMNRMANAMVAGDAGGGSEGATPIGQIEIKAEVTATFDIAPGQ